MSKTMKCVVAVVLAALIGILIVLVTVLVLPSQFDELYFGELADKYARLRSLENEKKIVVIGGSSVPFGIDSARIEEVTGYAVVDFGLYGPLGTAIMMDLTRGYIHEGDIVILAPETDNQTMSLTFNGEGMWECCDSDFTMLFQIRARDWGEMLGSFWSYAEKKYQFYLNGKAQPDGIYSHASFNEYGDIGYSLRTANIMDGMIDPDTVIDLDPAIIDEEYIDFVNDYTRYCEKRGAQVYFSWPPMNSLAIRQDLDGILAFATYVRDRFDAPLISGITQYIMAPEYFYDTNYHLIDTGVAIHTARLAQDIVNIVGGGTMVEVVIPEPTAAADSGNTASGEASADGTLSPAGASAESAVPTPVPTPEIVGSSRDADYFLCEAYNEGLLVTGLTDEGKQQTELEVPWLINGEKVIAIDSNTFDGCDSLRTIYIQSNIGRIMQGAFDGAPRLREIHIDNEDGANVLIPGSGLFDNVPTGTKVYVPADSYGLYLGDYFWANYNDRLEKEK